MAQRAGGAALRDLERELMENLAYVKNGLTTSDESNSPLTYWRKRHRVAAERLLDPLTSRS
jgi:hypothetical protein